MNIKFLNVSVFLIATLFFSRAWSAFPEASVCDIYSKSDVFVVGRVKMTRVIDNYNTDSCKYISQIWVTKSSLDVNNNVELIVGNSIPLEVDQDYFLALESINDEYAKSPSQFDNCGNANNLVSLGGKFHLNKALSNYYAKSYVTTVNTTFYTDDLLSDKIIGIDKDLKSVLGKVGIILSLDDVWEAFVEKAPVHCEVK